MESFKQNPPCNFHAGFILVPCAPDASHVVSQCRETLGAERMRASHEVSQCHEALGVQSDCTPKKSPIDVGFGRQRQTVPLAP